jgi:hypothetical protein
MTLWRRANSGPLRTSPTHADLMAELQLSADDARQMRNALRRGKMEKVKAPGFYGVGYIHKDTGEWVLAYLVPRNAYTMTIVRRAGSSVYRINTLAGEIEALKYAGVRLAPPRPPSTPTEESAPSP